MPIQRSSRKYRPQPLFATGYLITMCTLAPLALAAGNPGAHEHGHARLQLAVEQNRIDLLLNSPAQNLAGFEHEARTENEKSRLDDINRWLEATPLINPLGSTCRVTSAAVELGGSAETRGKEDHYPHEDSGHQDHEDNREETNHREYDVTQQLECDRIDSGEQLTSELLDRFPNLEQLTVEWVGPSGQGSARLTPSNPTFTVDR